MKDYNEMAESVLNRRDKYVVERKKQLKKRTTAISCVCLCALLGVGAWKGGMLNEVQPPIDTEQIEKFGSSPNAQEEQKKEFQNGLSGENQISGEDPDVSSTVIDAPVQNEADNTGALAHFDEVWGGSYLDNAGHWVVWLTEDTPENRAEVFKRNPSISESGTEFKTADFSLAYLTQLMADISEAMMDGQLPFVTSASLREDYNRVEVNMTAESADFIAKVQSFDTLGGAIEFKYGASTATEDILTEDILKEPIA